MTTFNSIHAPLVSVMMPARNAALHLSDTIRSIQNQTYKNWELIFVDDGSTDNTFQIIQELSVHDSRIRAFTIPHGGRGRARNACISHIRGEYLAICDADDISFPERFAKQVAYLQAHPEIGAVASWWIPFSTDFPQKNGPVRKFPTTPTELRRAFQRRKMRFHNATAMLRASLFASFGGYNAELKRAQDYEFFARLSQKGIQFAALEEPLLYYRQEANIPSLSYFRENGMFMSYANRILMEQETTFDDFEKSPVGIMWKAYFSLKYLYFYAKMSALNRDHH